MGHLTQGRGQGENTMRFASWRRPALTAALLTVLCATATATEITHPDHYEFDATIDTPFTPRSGLYPITLRFDYPASGEVTAAAWTLEAVAPDGQVVRSWQDVTRLVRQRGLLRMQWDGRDARGKALPAGYYTLRLRAAPTVLMADDTRRPLGERVHDAFTAFEDEVHVQTIDVMVGRVAPGRVTPMSALPVGAQRRGGNAGEAKVAATNGLPYTIYYGNMHSQTNHSDGGAAVTACSSAESPQAGAFGPTDAFTMMRTQAGGDFLLASEHNHMYDGSTGTNTSANPASAIALFDSGLAAASNYRTANPGFMALYGLEWGVISNGGHLNIINPDALPSWEYTAGGALIGEVATPKSDYATLYTTMRQRGWIGQFNHPSSSQFAIGGTGMAYNADGAEVMVLAEVLNSSAFSTNTTQTEASRSSYVGAWNTLLERGYKVAPATNQDNHCANWGLSFTNRTGVLLPNGVALSSSAFIDALKARRTFATEDSAGQLVLTANGRVMGETFANTGPLTLTVNYASTSGQTVQRVQFFEGVPGRNGTVTQLVEGSGTHTFTPSAGAHFYYALVTQANGLRLWSAPVWVNQGAGGDTTPPTATASVTGTSGTITLNATASDNVGVTNIEFIVDGVLRGSDATAPYSLAFDSTTLANGSHTLVARAMDAAGNAGSSSAVAFSVSNVVPDTTAPTATASVTGTSGTITFNATASDNVGVTSVEFIVDGVSRGTDTTAPYSLAFNSTALTNGSHTLVARARDAAGNIGNSSSVAFSVNNPVTLVERLTNTSFESGTTGWTATSGVITNSTSYAAKTGTWKAWLNGYGSANTDTVYQTVSIPSTATTATLTFWLRVDSAETTTTQAYDVLRVQVRNGSNTVLGTLATYSNLNETTTYVQRTFDVSAWRGQTVRIFFEGVEGSQVATSFLVDDVSLKTN